MNAVVACMVNSDSWVERVIALFSLLESCNTWANLLYSTNDCNWCSPHQFAGICGCNCDMTILPFCGISGGECFAIEDILEAINDLMVCFLEIVEKL